MTSLAAIVQEQGWNDQAGSPLYEFSNALTNDEQTAREIIQAVICEHAQKEWDQPPRDALIFLLTCIRKYWLSRLRTKDPQRFWAELDALAATLPGTAVRLLGEEYHQQCTAVLDQSEQVLFKSLVDSQASPAGCGSPVSPEQQARKQTLYNKLKRLLASEAVPPSDGEGS